MNNRMQDKFVEAVYELKAIRIRAEIESRKHVLESAKKQRLAATW